MVALTKKEATKEVSKRRGPEHDQTLARVKQSTSKAPVLHYPDLSHTTMQVMREQELL